MKMGGDTEKLTKPASMEWTLILAAPWLQNKHRAAGSLFLNHLYPAAAIWFLRNSLFLEDV